MDGLSSRAVEPSTPETAQTSSTKTRASSKATLLLGASGGALVVVMALVLGMSQRGLLDRFKAGGDSPRIASLAVLPLQNLSGGSEKEYFADGMMEALISRLGKVEDLRVISRTSAMLYKNAHKPLPEIARELNVDAVVEGSVLLADGKVRITVELVHAAIPICTRDWRPPTHCREGAKRPLWKRKSKERSFRAR